MSGDMNAKKPNWDPLVYQMFSTVYTIYSVALFIL